jgi:hypothetical protein
LHTVFTSTALPSQRNSPEAAALDAVYLLLLATLYLVTHGLVWALARLGEAR